MTKDSLFSICFDHVDKVNNNKLSKQYKLIGNKFVNIKQQITQKKCNEFGWLDIDALKDKTKLDMINKLASKIKKESDILLVIGIGGSSLGSKAIIEALSNNFKHNSKHKTDVIFVGDNLNIEYIYELKEYLLDKEFSINLISKSGKTFEPLVVFEIFKTILKEKYGSKYNERIYITTNTDSNLLNKSDINQYNIILLNSKISGRYSVLTEVGLLPICVAGYNIDNLLEGAEKAYNRFFNSNINNECTNYAILRNELYKQGKYIELLVTYNPKLNLFMKWIQQLFAESEGKNGKGIFPSTALFPRDLHSIGQYIQEGPKKMFETVISVNNSINDSKDIIIDSKILNIKNIKISELNSLICSSVTQAHFDGKVSNIIISISKIDEFTIGYVILFFELACYISATLLNVDPFTQQGVSKYKNNIFNKFDTS